MQTTFHGPDPNRTSAPLHDMAPAFAYWAELGNKAVLWVTHPAYETYRLGTRVPIHENPPNGAYTFADEDEYPTDGEPQTNIVLVKGPEASQIIAGLTPGKICDVIKDKFDLSVIHRARVDVVIRLPSVALGHAAMRDAVLSNINRNFLPVGWTEQLLKRNELFTDQHRLLAHMLIDISYGALLPALGTNAYLKAREKGTTRDSREVAAETGQVIQRSRNICHNLHAIFCRDDHRPASDAVHGVELREPRVI